MRHSFMRLEQTKQNGLSKTSPSDSTSMSSMRRVSFMCSMHQQSKEHGKNRVKYLKCPKHNLWLQPEQKPFPHWKCSVAGCNHIMAAKLRTFWERKVFNG